MLIIDKINADIGLTSTEMSVAEYTISLGEDLEKYSTRQIAKETHSSPATVIRFCKKIGLNGFDEFKLQYLRELNYLERQFGKVDVNFPFDPLDTTMKIANKIAALHTETISDTLLLLDHDRLEQARNMLTKTNSIYVFSFGTALNQAESFKEKLMKIGKKVVISTNLNYQLYEASCMENDDLAIIISYSGETQRALTIASLCRERRNSIIAITSVGGNTLSTFANNVLYMSSKEKLSNNVADYSIHVSVNYLLDTLYSVMFREKFKSYYDHKINIAKELEEKRSSTNSILMNNQETM